MPRDFGRPIRRIVLHTTATPLKATVESILDYWKDVLGWRQVGYHYLIDYKGGRNILAKLSEVTNGVHGYNKDSVHISTIGGLYMDDRTPAQKAELIKLIKELRSDDILGNVPIVGHTDLNPKKACPRYDVKTWLKSVGL